jgi:hypothetical protein
MIPLSEILPLLFDFSGLCPFFCRVVVSGGGVDGPGHRATGHAALQPAVEDPLQSHEH